MNEATPEPKRCEVCGAPLRRGNLTGLCCVKGRPACQKERDKRRRAGHPASTLTRPPYLAAGTILGRLTVIQDVLRSHDPALCRCECGVEKNVRSIDLAFGRVRSCGCLRRELHTIHGCTGHPLYRAWAAMISRTTDPNNENYHNYGGRGITVCDRWRDARLFIEDIERDLGPRPTDHSLDRIDNESEYKPGNVKWSTSSEQVLNQRKVPVLTRERDALAAKAAELEARLIVAEAEAATLRRRLTVRKRVSSAQDQEALF